NRINSLCSEVEIITNIATRIIDKRDVDFGLFTEHRNIRDAIANLIPGFEKLANIDDEKKEFHIGGRHFPSPRFSTESGKASFRVPSQTNWERQDQLNSKGSTFLLTSVRSEGQFNTIIYNEEDIYRRQKHRKVLFMNPSDIENLDIKEGALVNVSNNLGQMKDLTIKSFDIKPGNIMTYFPEANILIPQDVDSRSRTPSFKSIEVTVLQKDC
ncbi:histidine kinase, partial [Gammaproteobacteria bacterium]|nr:histidine kinase [Gammaproteobacteria bacterium]